MIFPDHSWEIQGFDDPGIKPGVIGDLNKSILGECSDPSQEFCILDKEAVAEYADRSKLFAGSIQELEDLRVFKGFSTTQDDEEVMPVDSFGKVHYFLKGLYGHMFSIRSGIFHAMIAAHRALGRKFNQHFYLDLSCIAFYLSSLMSWRSLRNTEAPLLCST